MDLRGYKPFRTKLKELLDCIHEFKTETNDGNIRKDLMKKLVEKSEEWLELSEDINEQLKEKKQVLVKSHARNNQVFEEDFMKNLNDD